jgi:hypothetical protein
MSPTMTRPWLLWKPLSVRLVSPLLEIWGSESACEPISELEAVNMYLMLVQLLAPEINQ